MLEGAALARALARIEPRPFSGPTFRLVHARYSATLLSSEGSLHGGRFNPPGTFPVLYAADSPVTALLEVEALTATVAGLRPVAAPPRLLLTLETRLEAMLDLTDEAVMAALRTGLDELTAPWRPANARGERASTQSLGLTAFEGGRFEAIRSPSARDRSAANIGVLPDRLRPGSSVQVFDPSGTLSARLP